MRHRTFSLCALTTLVLVGCETADLVEPPIVPTSSSSVQAPVYVVTGGGSVATSSGLGTYAFSSSIDGAGGVRGQAEVHFASRPWEIHATVTCLVVVGDNAWMGAVITESNATSARWQVGGEFVWRVQDNGEGEGSVADRFRGFAAWPAAACETRPDFPLIEWTNGNVQINMPPRMRVVAPSYCGSESSDGIARFADSGLEVAVRTSLGLGETDEITCEAAASLENLFAGDLGIASLDGLQNLTGLYSAELGGNAISDLGPVGALPRIQWVGLSGNAISDLTPVSALTTLTGLELGGNQISDLGPLSGLASLGFLGLGGNQVADVGPLAGLTGLYLLGLGNNQLSDITALAGLTGLTELFLVNNTALSDIGPLLANADAGGLGAGDRVELWGTSVSCADVAALQDRGMDVSADCT